MPGKAEPAGTHRSGDATTGQRGRLGAAMCDGVLTEEGVGGDVGELLQHCTWRGGEEQREIGRRTWGGGAHREAAATAMVARLVARSGRGMDAGVD
jgi:hypothetical protein